MKRLLPNKPVLTNSLLTILSLTFLLLLAGCHKGPDYPPTYQVTTLASGLINPIGVDADKYGNAWVALAGTGNNDGKVVLITKNGTVYNAIINFESSIDEASGDVNGPSHLLLDDGWLYILVGKGKLFKANVAAFKPGHAPVQASSLAFEDMSSFVLSYPFVNNTHDTHPYNLTKGPGGDLYIADAGANAIIRRNSPGVFSILAELPLIPNPLPIGRPQIESVPTGIVWDGRHFLVTSLTGFPFPAGQARIYKVSLSGAVSIYQQGLTTLVDIEQGNSFGNLVLEYGQFGQMGFVPNTGRLLSVSGSSSTELAKGLNRPVGLSKVNDRTLYVTSMGDGTLLKMTY